MQISKDLDETEDRLAAAKNDVATALVLPCTALEDLREWQRVQERVADGMADADAGLVYHNKQVQEWLKDNEKGIRIFYLPSYCPELNPDEFLNQDVKSHLGRKRLKNKSEMVKKLNSHLKMRQRQPDVIQKFIRGCHPKYAT